MIVALVDSPALDVLRRDAEDALAVRGIAIPSEHGFTAHMTSATWTPADPDPVGRLAPFPVTFTGVIRRVRHAALHVPRCCRARGHAGGAGCGGLERAGAGMGRAEAEVARQCVVLARCTQPRKGSGPLRAPGP